MVIKQASSYCVDSAPLTFFTSFVLVLASFCLLVVGVEDYCCTLSSHSVTHTHSTGLPWTTDRSVAETSVPANTQHPQERETSIPPAGFERTFLPIYVCVCVCVCVYIYIYTHTHTHTHTHTVYQIPEAVKRSKLYCLKE